MRTHGPIGAFVLAAALSLICAPPAAAAPPANDNFADAQTLSGSTATATGTNVEATGEAGEPDHAGESAPLASAWYRWMAPADGRFRIDTCGSALDTTLGVYTGTAVDGLTEVAANDQDPTGQCADQSRVRFDAVAGTTYRIAVDGYIDDEGDLAVNVAPAPVPVNDAFADAQTLTGSTATAAGSNVDATGETGEPDHTGGSLPLASVWYRWTAPAGGRFRIDTCGSTFDTTLGVYTGTAVDGLTEVAANDEDPTGQCPGQSVARFDAVAGTTYRIAVDGFLGGEGDVTINVGPISVPGNDAFAAASTVPSQGGTLTGTNVNSTGEPGEPDHAGSADPLASVWWRWTAPESGLARIDTCGSSLDTVLAVYTGASVSGLAEIAANDDALDPVCGPLSSGLESELAFNAQAGTTYAIAVDGFEFSEGDITLRVTAPARSEAPPQQGGPGPQPTQPTQPTLPPIATPATRPPDTTAPSLTVAAAARKQKLDGSVDLPVTCGSAEDCIVSATGKLSVPGAARLYRLGAATTRTVRRGRKTTLRLKVPRTARTAGGSALRRRKRVKATIAVRVADSAGNARTLKQTVRFKR